MSEIAYDFDDGRGMLFTPTRIAFNAASEPACFGLVAGCLVAILVASTDEDNGQQWYLEAGFGPCAREGLLFSSLEAAAVG